MKVNNLAMGIKWSSGTVCRMTLCAYGQAYISMVCRGMAAMSFQKVVKSKYLRMIRVMITIQKQSTIRPNCLDFKVSRANI